MSRALVLRFVAMLAFAAPTLGQAWPFGVEGTGPTARGRDLFNLGVLGAKAWDADREEPSEEVAGGRRSVQSSGRPATDEGPARLRIEVLYPGGPAAAAGLEVGDVVVGVGSKSFEKDGSFEPLADALAKAMGGSKKGVVELRVERAGSGRAEKVEVSVEVLDKVAAKPESKEARRLFADRALAWLVERQEDDGGFAQTLSGRNGAVVQTCVAGLAWIAGGSDLASGPHAESLTKAVAFVRAWLADPTEPAGGLGGGANWNQDNWGYAHAAIFLGELHEHAPNADVLAGLKAAVDALFASQEESGGWAHGPGGPNALGYVELNIVAGLALSGLGLAKRAGVEVDEDAVEKALAYVEASSAGGGVGYSTNPGQVGQGNVGRTAATWLGLRNLGEDDKSVESYVKGHVDDWLGGHASLMQHVFLAGVAAAAGGSKTTKTFWMSAARDLVLALAPDGSLQPRPWYESLSIGSNSDVSFGEVWTTAAWATVLLAEPTDASGLPAWCGD